jgi:hypothetical protein
MCQCLLNPSPFPSPPACRVFTGRLSPGVDFSWPQARAVTGSMRRIRSEPRIQVVLFDSEFKLEIRFRRQGSPSLSLLLLLVASPLYLSLSSVRLPSDK